MNKEIIQKMCTTAGLWLIMCFGQALVPKMTGLGSLTSGARDTSTAAFSSSMAYGDDKPKAIRFTERGAAFSGGVSGEWLEVRRYNLNDHANRAFDPSYVAIVSDFKPIVRKVVPDPSGTDGGGKWEITFMSEIAKDLP
jgi:hypothetical protein